LDVRTLDLAADRFALIGERVVHVKVQIAHCGGKAWRKAQVEMLAETKVRNDVDVVAGQGFAGHSVDAVHLREIFGVHGEVVPIQSDVEPEVQLVFVVQGLVAQSGKLGRER